MKMKKKGQSIIEYAVILGVIAVALSVMQLYFQRGIQGVVKVAADEVGSQKKGAADVDYKLEWKWKGTSVIDSSVNSASTTKQAATGEVTYDKSDTSAQRGILSQNIFVEK